MASPETILTSVENSTKINRIFDDQVCMDIQKRIESKMAENRLTIAEKADFAKKNFLAMNKWEQMFPTSISQCLREYFRAKCMWSPHFDPRFPNQNQTKKCFVNFVDWQRCLKYKGSEDLDCDYFKQTAIGMCPEEWLDKFKDQLENDSFPIDI